MTFGVASLSIVRAEQHEILRYIRPGPVEAARLGISPCRGFRFQLLVRLFIRYGQADIVGVLRFAVPESGIDVAVTNGDRAVGLSTERICVDPEGFQRLGIERLHTPIGECNEQHAVRIGRTVDGEAGLSGHRPSLDRLSGILVDAVERVPGINDECAVHQNGAADCAAARCIAVGPSAERADLLCPIEHSICSGDWRFCRRHGVIVRIAAEVRPFGLKLGQRLALRCFFQRQADAVRALCFAVQNELKRSIFLFQRHSTAFAEITRRGQEIVVGKACREGIGPIFVRPDPAAGDSFLQEEDGVFRIQGKLNLGGRSLLYRNGINAVSRGVRMGEPQRDRLRGFRSVQRDLGLGSLCYVFSIHRNAQHIAVVRIAIAQHFVSQHRSQRNRGLRRWDGHGILLRSGRKPKCARFLTICIKPIQRQQIAVPPQRQTVRFQGQFPLEMQLIIRVIGFASVRLADAQRRLVAVRVSGEQEIIQ